MDDSQLFQWLEAQLQLNNIIILPECKAEIRSLVLCKGFENEFFKCFIKCTKQLSKLGLEAINLRAFEKLQGAPNLFSMRLIGKQFNIRILFSYEPNVNVFTLAFFEKEGKRTTNYTKMIPLALSRLEQYRKLGGRL